VVGRRDEKGELDEGREGGDEERVVGGRGCGGCIFPRATTGTLRVTK
jgi:hypothetical protein